MLFYASAKPAGLPFVPAPVDKLVHFGYYAVLTILLIVAAGGRGVLIAALIVIGVGAADELYQSTVPQRHAEWLDFAADIVGALVAAVLFAWLARRRAAQRPTLEKKRARLERRTAVNPSVPPAQAVREERDSR